MPDKKSTETPKSIRLAAAAEAAYILEAVRR